MVMRGASPSAPCPRCGTIAPPTADRLVTCTECKLTFDPTAERAAVSIRRNRGAAMIERIKVTRAPAQLTVATSFERRKGIAITASGAAIMAGAVVVGLPYGLLAATIGILIAMLGILFVSPHVIRVDRVGISAGRLLGPRKMLPLTDLDKVETGAVYGLDEKVAYYVVAVSASGPNTLLFTTRSKELADHIARIVGDAVATMPPTSSSGTA